MSLTNLNRWIKASYVQMLRKVLLGAPLFVEGDDRQTSKAPDHFELRIDGPYTDPCGTQGEYKSFIEVNILVNVSRNEKNRYHFDNLKGAMAEALRRDFCIYRTGNVGKLAEDDESLVGVMRLIPSESIKISDFGMIDPATEVYQSVCEAHYEMYFSLE
jgi:hypothetical protein